ncbi:MAG TPA: alkaline phosphatase family protein [Mycobacteriales bacterium]|jgi:phospholipase C|nr:alkaline phosphatase family protein [Mycobacteriales bacterium]
MFPAVAAAAIAVGGVAVGVDATVSHSTPAAATTTKAAHGGEAVDRSVQHKTTTPIKHVVVLFDENVSFDHYFGTYPNAKNPKGETKFTAQPGTPTVNGLTGSLLTDNLNAYNPTRLSPAQAVTCDQNHSYKPEQQAADHGLMDKFSEYTGSGDCTSTSTGEYYRPGLVMDYYDGNTVTGLWNYAQRFSMSDNSYDTNFGPSTPGALNLISGQTHGATASAAGASVANGTLFGDADPTLDGCGKGTTVQMSGKNVGDLLNQKKITWGWFQGGFKPSSRTSTGAPVCGTAHANIAGSSSADYSAHHEPFEYYKSTANPNHLPPSSTAMIGKTDQANHQYDLSDFWTAADSGRLPEVSYLKAAEYQDGHAGYSDPIDEQHFLVSTINRIQNLPQWKDTAIVIAYDDSDGWYDHQMSPIVNASADSAQDAISGDGACGTPAKGAYNDRCGYGPRLPLMVLSPYSKSNYVDHSITDQSSVLKFIETNWQVGQIGDQSFDAKAGSIDGMFNFQAKPKTKPFLLDPLSGKPTTKGW